MKRSMTIVWNGDEDQGVRGCKDGNIEDVFILHEILEMSKQYIFVAEIEEVGEDKHEENVERILVLQYDDETEDINVSSHGKGKISKSKALAMIAAAPTIVMKNIEKNSNRPKIILPGG